MTWLEVGSVRGIDGNDNAVRSIETPHSLAIQDVSDEALAVRRYVEEGGELYRAGELGHSNTTDAQFWAPVSPMTLGYAEKYGVAFDDLDYITDIPSKL